MDFYARQTVKRTKAPSAFLPNKLHMSILHFQFKFFALTTPRHSKQSKKSGRGWRKLKFTLSARIISYNKMEKMKSRRAMNFRGNANAGDAMHWPWPNENLEVSSRTGQTTSVAFGAWTRHWLFFAFHAIRFLRTGHKRSHRLGRTHIEYTSCVRCV